MGQYVDIGRKVIKLGNKTVISNPAHSGTIVKVIPLKKVDASRHVFFIKTINSSNEFGLVTNPSTLDLSIASGTATVNSNTISWGSQSLTAQANVYGIIGINVFTSLVQFNTGMVSDVVPLCVIGTSDTTIPYLYNLCITSTYLCVAKQILQGNTWTWLDDPYLILGSAESASFSDTINDDAYISFVRNGAVYRRRFSESNLTDWELYRDYIDVANVRYIMPQDKSLIATNMATSSSNSSNITANFKAYSGYFSTPKYFVDNIVGESGLKVFCRLPLFNVDTSTTMRYFTNLYTVKLNDNLIHSDTYKNSIYKTVEIQDDSTLEFDVIGTSSVFSDGPFWESFEGNLVSNADPIYVSDTNTRIEVEVATPASTIASMIEPVYTITGEVIYIYNTNYEYLNASASSMATTVVPTYTITSEVIYLYNTQYDYLYASSSTTVSMQTSTFTVT